MKKILFIYDAPLCPEKGGTERATKLVMDELARRGYKCVGILHFSQQKPDIQYLNGEKIESLTTFLSNNKFDIVVNQIAFHPRFLNQFLSFGGKEWQENGGKIISFMHLDPTPPPNKPIVTYFSNWRERSLLSKFKRILYVLSLPIFNYLNYKKYQQGLNSVYMNSDSYVLMSETYRLPFVQLAQIQDQSKIKIIPNMLTFPDNIDKSILKYKKNVVLVVARLDDEQKNISFIIEIWRSISDHRGYTLHILGDGKDRDILMQKAVGIPDLIFEGPQSPQEWYKVAKIFLMASPREGWGLTITESLQFGVVPIVLNTSSVFADLVTHGTNGLLANNSNEYKKYLQHLISDDIYREVMACQALISAQRFSAGFVGDIWEELLKSY